MRIYILKKSCWINQKYYPKYSLIKLEPVDAKEWCERGCLGEYESTQETQSSVQLNPTQETQSSVQLKPTQKPTQESTTKQAKSTQSSTQKPIQESTTKQAKSTGKK